MSETFGRRAAAVVVAAVMLLSACGDDSVDSLEGNVVQDGLGCKTLEVDRPTEAPTVEATEPVTEMVTEDLVEPDEDGCSLTVRPYITLDMVGAKASDGSVFISTYGTERPVTAQLGQGQFIAGLETGIGDMKVGGRRKLVIPAAEAYGPEGSEAQGIGPDETLVFVVDVVAVSENPQFCNLNQGIPPAPEGVPGGETKPTEAIDMPLKPVEELAISTVREGTGAEVKEGDSVLLNYVGVSCATGQQFDTSWDRGETLPATAGGDDTIEGFSQGIIGAKIGELRRLDIPAEQAYGDDALTFLIQVMEIVPPEAATTTTEPGAADPASDDTEPATETTEAGEGDDGAETDEADATTTEPATDPEG